MKEGVGFERETRLERTLVARKRSGKNLKAHTTGSWVEERVAALLVEHSPTLSSARLTLADRVRVAKDIVSRVKASVKPSAPAFYQKAKRKFAGRDALNTAAKYARKMVWGFLRLSKNSKGVMKSKGKPRFYIDEVAGMGLAVFLRPGTNLSSSSSTQRALPEFDNSTKLSKLQCKAVAGRSFVELECGQVRELIGPAALMNGGCAFCVQVIPKNEFREFVWDCHVNAEAHDQIFLAYGMTDASFDCDCGNPLA